MQVRIETFTLQKILDGGDELGALVELPTHPSECELRAGGDLALRRNEGRGIGNVQTIVEYVRKNLGVRQLVLGDMRGKGRRLVAGRCCTKLETGRGFGRGGSLEELLDLYFR
jgi:hypothetical protein